MEKDFNLKKDTCLNDDPENTNSLKELQKNALLQRVEQEFNENSLVKRKKIKVKFVYNTSYPDGYMIQIVQENNDHIDANKKMIFGWRRSTDLLTQLMLEIQDQVHIFADRFLVDAFVRMANSEDLSHEDEIIYIACKTNLFGYIVDRLKPYCKSFNPTTVERCGLFVSKKGIIIRACNLYNITTDNLQERILIDRIFKKYL